MLNNKSNILVIGEPILVVSQILEKMSKYSQFEFWTNKQLNDRLINKQEKFHPTYTTIIKINYFEPQLDVIDFDLKCTKNKLKQIYFSNQNFLQFCKKTHKNSKLKIWVFNIVDKNENLKFNINFQALQKLYAGFDLEDFENKIKIKTTKIDTTNLKITQKIIKQLSSN